MPRAAALLWLAVACCRGRAATAGARRDDSNARARAPGEPGSWKKPPLGWSSWNHFGMGVSAPLLLDVADAMALTGLRDAGFVFVNTDDGWDEFNRTAMGGLQPCAHFTNATVKGLADALHAKGYKFGIYAAAGFTTCGRRAGTLYHERQDAAQFKAWGVDYLKYDDCGEANIQSYAKYFVMKDALAAAYGPAGIDYYSFEPFQTYGQDAIPQMAWVSEMGDLWRTGADIVPKWTHILTNAFVTNAWAPNGRPGHWNDADMLEVGNGDLTLAEQRSHFALWCLMKSPLIIGADVGALPPASLTVLKTQGLIAVNQDDLGVQGTLRASFAANGSRAALKPPPPHAPCTLQPASCASGSKWMAHCRFGEDVPAAQQWQISDGKVLTQPRVGLLAGAPGPPACVARSSSAANADVTVAPCDASDDRQAWDFGRVNVTVSQVRAFGDAGSCLTFNSSSLHMEPCREEHGDKTTPNDSGCTDGGCRFSGIIYQLFYLNSLKQLTSAITNIPNGGSALLPMLPNFPANTPWCLATEPSAPTPPPSAKGVVDTSQPLQVWAGPLAGGDVVVLLLNTGNFTSNITASFEDVGLASDATARATDLWTGKALPGTLKGAVSAAVATHDSAIFRLAPV